MEEQKQLTYGYVISLSPFDNPNSYITSDGFVKNNAYIRDLSFSGQHQMHDRCLFKIYPSFSTQYIEKVLSKEKNQEILNSLKEAIQSNNQVSLGEIDNNDVINDSQHIDEKDLNINLKNGDKVEENSKQNSTNKVNKVEFPLNDMSENQIKEKNQSNKKKEEKNLQYQNKVKNEYKQNLNIFEKLKGSPIQFEKPIQLLHVASNKFLVCNYTEAEVEKENFKLELQEFSSKNTHFKFLPSFSHQKRSDSIIQISDVVYITSSKLYLGKTPFLYCSKEGKLKGAKNKGELLERDYNYIEKSQREVEKYKQKLKQQQLNEQIVEKSELVEEENDENQSKLDVKQPYTYKTKIDIEETQRQIQMNDQLPNPSDFQINQVGHHHEQQTLNYNPREKNVIPKNLPHLSLKQKTMRKEANVSLENKTKWKIQPFSEYIEEENDLCFGEVIWLHHIENTNAIVLSKKGSGELMVKMEGTAVTNSQFQKYEGNTNGMWILEHQNYNQGGQVQWDQPIFLRNLSLGKYLAIDEQEHGNQIFQSFTTVDKTEENKKQCMFSFSMMPYAASATDVQKTVKKDSFFYIKSHFKEGGFIHIKDDKLNDQHNQNYIDDPNDENKQNFVLLNLKEEATDEDAFKLYRATMSEVLEQSFLISCFPVVKKNLDNFNRLQQAKTTNFKVVLKELDKHKIEKKIKTLQRCLIDLEKFVTNKLILTNLDQQKNYGKPNRQRQKVLYEQDYIKNLVNLLKFMTNYQELHTLKERQEKEKRVKLLEERMKNKNFQPISQQCIEGPIQKMKMALKRKYNFQFLEQKKQSMNFMQLVSDVDKRKKKRVMNYYKTKVGIMKQIYQLLQSICQDNENNQKHVNTLFHEFQYQTKFIHEAVQCIISIIQQNELILTNLCDDIKIKQKNQELDVEDKQEQFDNDEENSSQVESRSEEQQVERLSEKKKEGRKSELENNNTVMYKNISDQNLLMFFTKQVEENGVETKNIDFLKFFRTICKYKNKGLSVNQEQIFRLLKLRKIFHNSLFYPIKVTKNMLQITFQKGKMQYLEKMDISNNYQNSSDGQHIQYLIEQLRFYSDLALSRNFLWKNELDPIFPIQYVVQKIFQKEMHTDIRSAFCNLAITQYIDHEPFNQIILPNKCRIHYTEASTQKIKNLDFIFKNEQNAQNSNLEDVTSMDFVFLNLIEKTTKYFEQILQTINGDFQKQFEKQKNQDEKTFLQGPQILNNMLTYDITKMLGTMMQFGVFSILQKNELYPQFVQFLVSLLEYNYQLPQVSGSLERQRKDNFKISLQNETQNKIFKGFKGIIGQVVNVINTGVGMVIDIADFTAKKLGILSIKKQDIEEELAEYSQNNFQKNPLLGGLISLINMLNKEKTQSIKQQNPLEAKIEAKIKKQICNQLIFLQKLRIDFLISNFISWFDSKGSKYPTVDFNDEIWRKKCEDDIEEDLNSVIPDIFKTGIKEVDIKYTFKAKNMMSNIPGMGLFNSEIDEVLLKKAKPKKFQIFTNNNGNNEEANGNNNANNNQQNQAQGQKKIEKSRLVNTNDSRNATFIQDLETLLSGIDNKNQIKSEIIPSLLVTFTSIKDSELEDLILEVIYKCFMQTSELFEYLHEIEVLFDDKDILPYVTFQTKIQDLRLLAEKSEVWLSEFEENMATNPQHQDITRTIELLEQIKSLFYEDSVVDKNGQIVMGDSRVISKTRQKIFTFLSGHLPLINLVKDAQNQMAKILKQHNIKSKAKKTIYTLLRNLYKCLQIFCHEIEENQEILYPHIQYFLDEIKYDFGQFDLLVAIYKNNKNLCQQISESTVNQVLQAIKDQGRQERFLRLFTVLMQRTDKNGDSQYIVDNQIMVFKLFIPTNVNDQNEKSKFETILFSTISKSNTNQPHNTIQFTLDVGINKKQLQQQSNIVEQPTDYPFYYHAALLDIYMIGISGDEGLNLNGQKVKKCLPLKYLLEELCQNDILNESNIKDRRSSQMVQHDRGDMFKVTRNEEGYGILKPKIAEFILQVYLNIDKQNIFETIDSLSSMLELFEFEKNRIKHLTTLQEPYKKYFFGQLLRIFYIYTSKVLQNKDDPYSNQEPLKEFAEIMILKIEIMLANATSQDIENVLSLIREIDNNLYESKKSEIEKILDLDMVQTVNRNDPVFNLSSVEKQSSQSYTSYQKMASKISQGGQQTQGIIKKNRQNNNPIIEDQQEDGEGDDSDYGDKNSKDELNPHLSNQWISQQSWQFFLQTCSNSSALAQAQENQISALGECIINFDKLFDQQIVKDYQVTIDKKIIIEKLIAFLQNGIANKVQQKNLIYTLKLLKGILDNSEEEEKLEEMQNFLDSLNATQMFLHLVSDSKQHPFDNQFFIQLLDFVAKLLENGNEKVQQSIYNYFINDPQSEVFFQKIHQIFFDYIEFMKEQRKREEKGLQKKVNDQEQIELSELVMKLLQILQLFCEGHNLDLQNYLKTQKSSRNNFDMVTIVVELLYQYHFDLNDENYENIVKCLDSLTEFVQGPCQENQETIIDSKFFEIAEYILDKQTISSDMTFGDLNKKKSKTMSNTQRNARKNLTLKNGEIKRINTILPWKLERLRYKTMIMVSSLLELNSDSTVIKRIMRSLPLSVLKKNLKEIYRRYTKLYGEKYIDDALKHADLDDLDHIDEAAFRKLSKKKQKKEIKTRQKYELITETGFYIFFLIMQYLDLDSKDLDGETSSQLNEIKSDFDQGRSFFDYKNNIIGQLAKLVIDLVSVFYHIFKKAGSAMHKAVNGKNNEVDKEQLQKEEAELFKHALRFFNSNSAHIEVVRNNQIEKVHFILMPFCHFLPSETKRNFNNNVSRDSIHSKIQGLVDESSTIIDICKHEEKLNRFFEQNKLVAIFANYVDLWRDVAFILTIVLNIFILMAFDDLQGDGHKLDSPKIYNMTVEETKSLFRQCGTIMIVCSTFVVLFFLLKKGPIYVKQAWQENKEYLGKNLGKFQTFIRYIVVIFICFLKVLLQVEVLYYLSYGSFAFIATFYHEFFFAFHLTELIMRYPTLRNILKAVWEPKNSLLLTFMLILLVTYFLSVWGYMTFNDSYAGRCDSLIMCSLESFDRMFKADGGIGGWMADNKEYDVTKYDYGRFFFDNIANITVIILLVEIFSGIIIDKFSDLRAIEAKKNDDIKENCFICGHTRELFDRKSDEGFNNHVKKDHYLWNYVFYLAFLFDKDKNEYTGIEQYVYECYSRADNTYFPIQRALVLAGLVEEEEEQTVEQLKKQLEYFKNNIEKVQQETKMLIQDQDNR